MSLADKPAPSRRGAIPPFFVMEVMRATAEREAAGAEVLHLEVGQPSTAAPAGARAAAKRAIDDDVLGYSTALGIEPLRHRIADHYRDWYDSPVDPARVAVTMGASGACVLAFLACFDSGDRVAVLSPGYPCYRNMLQAFDVEVVDVPVDSSTRFQPTPELLEAHLPLDGLVVASPSNPTGTMIGPDEMDALLAWCSANAVRLVSDEIYHGICFDRPGVTAWRPDGDAVVVNSFSKYFSMTGWRLGWLLTPASLADPVERLAQNLFISAPSVSQWAGLAAFDCVDELEANVGRYRTNREILLEGLPVAGLDRLAPADGAFYVWAATDHLADDSQALCARWLSELGIAATPGVDFDPTRGHGFVRFSFAGSSEDITEAVERLADWTAARR
ncbi:MAG: aminotransferase class I/II-fold pyridoxal phosphate-dependent enzyme [Actinomycetota bacterium]